MYKRQMHDAKKIAKQYIQEHSEDGTGNFYDLFTICLNQMAEDDFFVRTGLNKIMSQAMNTEESSEPKDVYKRQTVDRRNWPSAS